MRRRMVFIPSQALLEALQGIGCGSGDGLVLLAKDVEDESDEIWGVAELEGMAALMT